jgi:hypothetical protein
LFPDSTRYPGCKLVVINGSLALTTVSRDCGDLLWVLPFGVSGQINGGQKWEYLWLQFRGFVNTGIEVPIINNQQNKELEKKKEKHHN